MRVSISVGDGIRAIDAGDGIASFRKAIVLTKPSVFHVRPNYFPIGDRNVWDFVRSRSLPVVSAYAIAQEKKQC